MLPTPPICDLISVQIWITNTKLTWAVTAAGGRVWVWGVWIWVAGGVWWRGVRRGWGRWGWVGGFHFLVLSHDHLWSILQMFPQLIPDRQRSVCHYTPTLHLRKAAGWEKSQNINKSIWTETNSYYIEFIYNFRPNVIFMLLL